MFKDDGGWKEFGVSSEDHTYFPFWLFCVLWAIISYGLVRMIYSEEAVKAAKAAKAGKSVASIIEPAEEVPPSGPVDEAAASGYYKLDSNLMKRKGIPRYIYVGEEKPSDLD